jgi:hypothetical protein
MHDDRPQHKLALAVVVLAVWTSGVVASADPQCAATHEWLFRLSIEDLLEVPIHCGDEDRPCADCAEALARQATGVGASYRGMDRRITNDGIQASPVFIVLDNVDDEP